MEVGAKKLGSTTVRRLDLGDTTKTRLTNTDSYHRGTQPPPELGAPRVELTSPCSLFRVRARTISPERALELLETQDPNDVLPYLETPEVLLDRKFVLDAYAANHRISTALYRIDPSFIETDDKLLELMAPSDGLVWHTLKTNEPDRVTVELAAAAFDLESDVGVYFDPSYRAQPAIADVAVAHMDIRLRLIDKDLLTQSPYAEQIVEKLRSGELWEHLLPEATKQHPPFAAAVAAKDWRGFSKRVQGSTQPLEVAIQGLQQNPLVWAELPYAVRKTIAVERKDLRDAYYELVGELHELGLEYLPSRVPAIDTIREIIHNRRHPERADDRPLAVVVYPTTDWNHAFEKKNDIAALTKGHRVLYYEATSDDGFVDHVKQATGAQEADVMVIGGHGTQTLTQLGGPSWVPPLLWLRGRFLNLADEPMLKSAGLSARIGDGARIILDSCSTGKGKTDGNNMANMLARLFPQAWIYAPAQPASTSAIFDDNHRVIGATWAEGVEGYTIEPSAELGCRAS